MPSKRLRRVVVAVAGVLTLAALVVTAGASARTNGPFDFGPKATCPGFGCDLGFT